MFPVTGPPRGCPVSNQCTLLCFTLLYFHLPLAFLSFSSRVVFWRNFLCEQLPQLSFSLHVLSRLLGVESARVKRKIRNKITCHWVCWERVSQRERERTHILLLILGFKSNELCFCTSFWLKCDTCCVTFTTATKVTWGLAKSEGSERSEQGESEKDADANGRSMVHFSFPFLFSFPPFTLTLETMCPCHRARMYRMHWMEGEGKKWSLSLLLQRTSLETIWKSEQVGREAYL